MVHIEPSNLPLTLLLQKGNDAARERIVGVDEENPMKRSQTVGEKIMTIKVSITARGTTSGRIKRNDLSAEGILQGKGRKGETV